MLKDEELLAFTKRARAIAEPIGPMHPLWDLIFDIEALLLNKETFLDRTEIEEMVIENKVK